MGKNKIGFEKKLKLYIVERKKNKENIKKKDFNMNVF